MLCTTPAHIHHRRVTKLPRPVTSPSISGIVRDRIAYTAQFFGRIIKTSRGKIYLLWLYEGRATVEKGGLIWIYKYKSTLWKSVLGKGCNYSFSTKHCMYHLCPMFINKPRHFNIILKPQQKWGHVIILPHKVDQNKGRPYWPFCFARKRF